MELVTSFRNPLVKRIKRLRQRKYRQAEGAFFVEGIRVVLAALEQGAVVECLVYAPALLTSTPGRAAVAQYADQGLPCHALDAAVFAAVSERENPAGLGAIVRRPLLSLDALGVTPAGVYTALVEVSDPGNLGTILRTIDAAGGSGLILVGDCVDPFHPTAVKASMGTLFSVPMASAPDTATLLAWARTRGLHTVATSAKATGDYRRTVYHYPALLLLGSEGAGLDAATMSAADCAVTIPMRGTASSLNLAVAAGLLLYELTRPGDQASE